MSEILFRLLLFIALFGAVALLEARWPRRLRRQPRRRRWAINAGLLLVDVVAQRLTLGAAAFLMAGYAQSHGWGLFRLVEMPGWFTALLGFVLLDLAIYFQHVLFHAVPLLWRLHRIHHTDLELDLSSGFRFHPFEILLSLLYKVAVVAALGISPWVVLAFEATLSGAALFTHANLRLPAVVDGQLRRLLVTPDMHRVHHSVIAQETNSNFGFFLACWDRLFGTYRAQPEAGHRAMTIGLADYRQPSRLGLARLLWLPFESSPQASDQPRSDAGRGAS
ncbi:sterol desaturase family protein [Marinobacterium aestuariivivens]|uniref:Sterol desaturase family protein n=1 Tax=Marinobacterium aestuariivivens TaxID=1698799 RepID=A0ABW1ZVZ6_9GAMM